MLDWPSIPMVQNCLNSKWSHIQMSFEVNTGLNLLWYSAPHNKHVNSGQVKVCNSDVSIVQIPIVFG